MKLISKKVAVILFVIVSLFNCRSSFAILGIANVGYGMGGPQKHHGVLLTGMLCGAATLMSLGKSIIFPDYSEAGVYPEDDFLSELSGEKFDFSDKTPPEINLDFIAEQKAGDEKNHEKVNRIYRKYVLGEVDIKKYIEKEDACITEDSSQIFPDSPLRGNVTPRSQDLPYMYSYGESQAASCSTDSGGSNDPRKTDATSPSSSSSQIPPSSASTSLPPAVTNQRVNDSSSKGKEEEGLDEWVPITGRSGKNKGRVYSAHRSTSMPRAAILSKQEQNKLLNKIRSAADRRFTSKSESIMLMKKIRRLRNRALYDAIMAAKDQAINCYVINHLIKNLPYLAQDLFDIAVEKK